MALSSLAPRILDESQLGGNYLVVDCTIANKIGSPALIDCGASGFVFIDEQFASQHSLPRHQLRVPRSLQVFPWPPCQLGRHF